MRLLPGRQRSERPFGRLTARQGRPYRRALRNLIAHYATRGGGMQFALTDEQRMIVDTVAAFVRTELYPHEDEVERLNEVPAELAAQIRKRALDAGLYAPTCPSPAGVGAPNGVGARRADADGGTAA